MKGELTYSVVVHVIPENKVYRYEDLTEAQKRKLSDNLIEQASQVVLNKK